MTLSTFIKTGIISIFIGFFNPNLMYAQTTITLDDFKMLNNTSWEGTLTYIDYQSGEPVPIATTRQITVTDKRIITNLQYTYEPHKNIKESIKIRRNGTYLGKQKVVSKTIEDDGTIKLITSYKGKDDNKKATMYITYEYNVDSYKVKKEVQFKGSDELFIRNSYEYKRIVE